MINLIKEINNWKHSHGVYGMDDRWNDCAEHFYNLGLKSAPPLKWRNAEEEQPKGLRSVIIQDRKTNDIEVLNHCLSVDEGCQWAYWDDVLNCFKQYIESSKNY